MAKEIIQAIEKHRSVIAAAEVNLGMQHGRLVISYTRRRT